MPPVEVLKFGSSVLRSSQDLHVAVDEIYRRWRSGCRVIAVVSAFEGITDILMGDVLSTIGTSCAEATAAYVATGEQRTAALLLGALRTAGISSRIIDPRDIRLLAEGSLTESTPIDVDLAALDRAWSASAVLVLPGFYGVDSEGRIALFGRGGSDLSALFLAAKLRAACYLAKRCSGAFSTYRSCQQHYMAHRFSATVVGDCYQGCGPTDSVEGVAVRTTARINL